MKLIHPDLLQVVYTKTIDAVKEILALPGGIDFAPQILMLRVNDVPASRDQCAYQTTQMVGAAPEELITALHLDQNTKALIPKVISKMLRTSLVVRETELGEEHTPPDLVVHIAEGWMVALNVGDEDRLKAFRRGDISPAEASDKTEAMVINMHSLEGTVCGVLRLAENEAGQKIITEVLPLDFRITGNLSLNEPAEGEDHIALH